MKKTKAELIVSLQDQLLTEEQLRDEATRGATRAVDEMKKALKAKANWFRLYRIKDGRCESLEKDVALWKKRYTELENSLKIKNFLRWLLFYFERNR